ncbi:MAG: glycosyltransferase family 4 protein [Mariprofundales bacterium]
MQGDALRVMLVVNEFPPEKIAGTAMATQALAEHLEDAGHQVCVVVTTRCPQGKENEIKPHRYQLRWLQERPCRGVGWVWRIVQVLYHARRFRPDIIQGQAVSCGLIAAVVGHLLRIPSICYAQGYDVYQSSPWQQRIEIRWGCLWTDRLLAVTQHLATRIEAITTTGKAEVLPHAFSLPEPMPARSVARQYLGLHDQDHLVLSVGRLELFKGHDVLLNAWPDCLNEWPSAQLRIAGTGSREQELQHQVAALGIADSVRFVGHLAANEIHQWMAAADLFVLPSRSEPFGIVLLEAMTHGLPIVASAVGGVPEVLPLHGNCQLVPSDNPTALSSAILSLLGDDFIPSQENRAHALRFEWKRQVERFESIYLQLLR